jgi:outer membrane murein-binding lipoprotein Lpp
MTILALAFAAASIAGCIVLGVVVDHQRRTIDRLAQDVDDLWGVGDTLDLDTEGEHHE